MSPRKGKYLLAAIFSVFCIGLISMGYYMVEYHTFGALRLTRAVNSDFDYLENFFQREPEEIRTPIAPNVPMVKVPIIIYHSIRPYIPGESMMQDRFDITPELFEQQLAFIQAHGYTTISPDSLARDIRRGTTTPIAKPILLTFDDGWENQYQYAFPLLVKYHMTATFYVYTKPIDLERRSYLSWGQLGEMSAAGMTIGSHTLSHPLLGKLSQLDIKKEIFDSKKIIEARLGKAITNFAQPYGYTSPEIEALIKDAGYTTARGTHKGVYHSVADQYDLQGYFTCDNFNEFIYILSR